MPNERLQLEIVGKASGQAEIDKPTQAFNRYVKANEDGAKKVQASNQQLAESIKSFASSPLDAAASSAEKFVLSLGKAAGIAAIGTAAVALVSHYASAAERIIPTPGARPSVTVWWSIR